MVRIAGFFAGGVVTGVLFPAAIPIPAVLALIALFALAFFVLKFSLKENKLPLVIGLLSLAVIFLLGYARLFFFNDLRKANHFSKVRGSIEAYEAIVRSVPEEKEKSWKVEIEVKSVKTSDWKPAVGKLLLYVSKQSVSKISWHYGDRILVKGTPEELKAPANPGEFDFKRFMQFRNISHQQFVRQGAVKFIAPVSRKGFLYYSQEARSWSMKKLSELVHGENERAIAIALVLGVTEGIDDDLLNAYAASGAMHVLAVSGMHVGIIYAILLFLFKPIESYKQSRWIVAIVSLVLLWAFAFVTGLSPSVLRAVTMFSFIAVARPFGKRTNIYNTLASSVLVLLTYNPYLILSVGFQLSYLAVLGIVYLQPPLSNLWEIENRVGNWIWQITCVSLSAQAATLALSLLYFHQFPTYFLISNLFIIPLSTLVLLVGILLLLVSAISPLASLTGMVLEWLIKALNWIVFKTESLPMSLIDNLYINAFQGGLLFGILLSILRMIESKSIRWFYVLVVCVVMFSWAQWHHFVTSVNQSQLIVYSISNHSAVDWIDRGHLYFEADSVLKTDGQGIRFHIQPNRLAHGVRDGRGFPMERILKGIKLLRIKNKTLAWIQNKGVKLPDHFKFDYLIVSRNSLTREEIKKIKGVMLILDKTNSARYVNSVVEWTSGNKGSVYSIAEKGAFILQ
jgi:competence protein ComEC